MTYPNKLNMLLRHVRDKRIDYWCIFLVFALMPIAPQYAQADPGQLRTLAEAEIKQIQIANRLYSDFPRSQQFFKSTGESKLFDKLKSTQGELVLDQRSIIAWSMSADASRQQYEYPVQRGAVDYQNYCVVVNRKYSFQLEKKRHPGSSWAITRTIMSDDSELDASKADLTINYPPPSRMKRVLATSIRGVGDHYVGADRLLDLPSLEIVSIDTLGDKSLTTLKFKCLIPSLSLSGEPSVLNELVFGPLPYRLPQRLTQSVVAGEVKIESISESEYNFDNSVPASRKNSRFYKYYKGSQCETQELSKEEIQFDFSPIPESEFTLSAYGFPEPPGVDWSWRMPAYGWALIVAFVCGSLVLYWRLRRKSS